MYKTDMDNIWVILKYVGPTFFKIMTKRLDKGSFFSESFRLCCNDNFIGKGIPHYHITISEFYRAPVAQLVEHRAVTREVASSFPAGPTLWVFK